MKTAITWPNLPNSKNNRAVICFQRSLLCSVEISYKSASSVCQNSNWQSAQSVTSTSFCQDSQKRTNITKTLGFVDWRDLKTKQPKRHLSVANTKYSRDYFERRKMNCRLKSPTTNETKAYHICQVQCVVRFANV